MRVPRPSALALTGVLLAGALAACGGDVAETPGGPPATGEVGEPQAPVVEDDTSDDGVGDSTTGDDSEVSPSG